MVKAHYKGTPCANLRNMDVRDEKEEVTCPRCLIYVHKTTIIKTIRLSVQSSDFEHSGNKMTDNTRKIPEFAIYTQYGSFKTPKMLIRKLDMENLTTPTELIIVSASVRSLQEGYYDLIGENMEFIAQCLFNYTAKHGFSLYQSVDSERLDLKYGEHLVVNYLRITANIDILALYTISMIAVKMAQVGILNGDIAKFDLLSHILSNQSYTSQRAYRCVVRTIFSGEYWKIKDKRPLVPSNKLFDLFSTYKTPSWVSTSKTYVSEIRLGLGQF